MLYSQIVAGNQNTLRGYSGSLLRKIGSETKYKPLQNACAREIKRREKRQARKRK